MKKLLVAMFAFASVSSVAEAKYVTVEVCDGGESGTICRTVTYKQREPSAPVEVTCTVPSGEAGEVPCPTEYGVPAWLKAINDAFVDAGFKAPNDPDPAIIGGP